MEDLDFWSRPTVAHKLELSRREQRQKAAAGWRRNIKVAAFLALLVYLVWYGVRLWT